MPTFGHKTLCLRQEDGPERTMLYRTRQGEMRGCLWEADGMRIPSLRSRLSSWPVRGLLGALWQGEKVMFPSPSSVYLALSRTFRMFGGRAMSSHYNCIFECAIAKRNARLADALGINPQSRAAEKTEVNYSNELVSFAKSDVKFLALVERTFADFVNGEKKNQVLPHMPVERRQFVHDLAALYRIDTQMVDQEPYRSVQLLRRVDTRIPAITLSTHIAANKSTTSNLGKLTDMSLRSGSSSWRSTPTVTPTTTPRSRAAPVPTTSDVGTSVRVWGAASQQALNRASPKPSSGTVPHSRTTTPAPPPPTSTADEPTTPVPADWEDDA
ncbi:hypothetical protein CCMSSC00406_0010216 [Pleurotus cornucopiae]|uniref:Uncharacterized protein n=1 Tax=Pleurotus cornucopiae TaxID=5321 RepID=A0ACB7IKI2_PLECO|nr:hypothetical protein CCMSSC00406_0010216 [Pleurotus cornucopiae]